MVIIFGHRGAPGYPRYAENTVASFNKALKDGAHGIEFDVRRCGDGRIVVIHDETIDRTTNGCGRVSDLSYEHLKQFDAGFGESIPLLSEILDKFADRCLLNIELKDTGLTADIKKLLIERNLETRVIVSAFRWGELQSLIPEIPVGLLSSTSDNLIDAATQIAAAAIHPAKDIVSPALLTRAKESNLRVHVWTVNQPDEISNLRSLSVDGIFTDFPERCSMCAS